MKEKEKEVTFQEELEKMEYEPLADIEIRLVRNSLIIGLVLLVVFYFTADLLFPAGH